MIFSLTSPNDREELQEPKDSLEKLCGGRGFGLLSRHRFFHLGSGFGLLSRHRFFFSRTRLRSSLETSFFYLGSGFGLLSGGAFFLKVGGGLRLNSEGAARELKYRNPGDKSFGTVFPDVPPQPLSCLTSAPSRPIRPPPPSTPLPPPNPTFPPPFSEIPLPKILRETFFVDISSWFPRLDLPTGENSRGRRWLLESARVAPRSLNFTNIRGVLGALIFEIFTPKIALKPDVFFENHDP